jgi:hypothetical protein
MIVWLASYPRSGNTFFRIILNNVFEIKTYSIYNDKSDIGADEATSKIVGHQFLPQGYNLELMRLSKDIYYIKTHELLNEEVSSKDKIVYLLRDGRDATISFWRHQNNFGSKLFSIEDIITGKNFHNITWASHVKSWLQRKDIFFIKFEDLIKNQYDYIEKIESFLGIKAKTNTIPTFSELNSINPKFFNKGTMNNWKDDFSTEDLNLFLSLNKDVLKEFDY